MDKSVVYILYTPASQYASQGGSPSNTQGYDIWIQEPDDEVLMFLGWITPDQLHDTYDYYRASCTVKVRP